MKALRIMVRLGTLGVVLSTSSGAVAANLAAVHHLSRVDSAAAGSQSIGWEQNPGLADQQLARTRWGYVRPHLSVAPTSGPPGSEVTVTGGGFQHKHCWKPALSFRDNAGTTTFLRTTGGTFSVTVAIPDQAVVGPGSFIENCPHYSWYLHRCIFNHPVNAGFTVTTTW